MYTFTHADTDVVTEHANLKAFKEWAVNNLALLEGVPFVHGTSVNDGTREFGKLRYIAPSSRAPRMVQPDADAPSLEDVLADIDRLELDDEQLIEDMDGDGSDFEDDEPTPVLGAAARAGIPTDEDIASGRVTVQGGAGLEYDPSIVGRGFGLPNTNLERTVRHARMSHKECGHATSGEAGKLARAACRAARRAEAAA